MVPRECDRAHARIIYKVYTNSHGVFYSMF